MGAAAGGGAHVKLAIDSYCYHRYFGEWYAGLQEDPGTRMTVWDFLARARELGVQGVSLESCFLPWQDVAFVERLAATLADLSLEPVWAWGHPNGLGSGGAPQQAAELVANLSVARCIGARVMRICGGSRHTRPASWPEHRDALLSVLRPLLREAESAGVVMAMENHVDLLADEMAELVQALDSPWFGVCLDTANNLRLLEDPLRVVRTLAPYARATHIKDVLSQPGDPRTFAFWPSVPLGEGAVGIPAVLQVLRESGYRGLLAIEIDYLHPRYGSEDAAVAASVDYLRSQLASLPPSP